MKMPVMRSSIMAHVESDVDAAVLEREILALAGVFEAKVVAEENTVFLRVDKQIYDADALNALLKPQLQTAEG